MAGYTIYLMVLRIPAVKYRPEVYMCDVKRTEEDVYKKLKEDKNVIDFSRYYR